MSERERVLCVARYSTVQLLNGSKNFLMTHKKNKKKTGSVVYERVQFPSFQGDVAPSGRVSGWKARRSDSRVVTMGTIKQSKPGDGRLGVEQRTTLRPALRMKSFQSEAAAITQKKKKLLIEQEGSRTRDPPTSN